MDSNCFDKDAYETGDVWGLLLSMKVVVSLLDEKNAWQKQIEFKNIKFGSEAMEEMSFVLQFLNTPQLMAIKQVEIEGESKSSAWSVSLTSKGSMSYEYMSFRVDSDVNQLVMADAHPIESTHTRLRVGGKISAEIGADKQVKSAFSKIYDFSGIHSSIQQHQDNSALYSGTLATINGTAGEGFETYVKNCNNDGAGFDCVATDFSKWNDITKTVKKAGLKSCYPTELTCEGIEPIVFGKGNEQYLLIAADIAELKKSPLAWYKALKKPLAFEKLTTAFEQLSK
jgi:hypothetical protein